MKIGIATLFICLVILFIPTTDIFAEDLGEFWPGKITICFSAELIGNTVGEFEITYEDDIVKTPFDWFNQLAVDYQIIY